MEFPKEELLEKYVRIYEQYIAPNKPDFEVAGGTTRYVRFNDAWVGLNPYDKCLISRLTNRKNTFPKKSSEKLKSNADPNNYIRLRYDSEGNLKMAYFEENGDMKLAYVYFSKQLTVCYTFDTTLNGDVTYELHDFEWYEYDDAGRLISEERFRGSGSPNDDVIIDSEYYEYDGDILSHAWQFTEFEKYPMELTRNLVMSWFPDRIICPQKFEFIFERVADGLDYTRNHYFRKSQTMTYKDHISEETLTHLAENGIRLV
ncbi:MAG: hypothetical protein II743_03660 [Lachnospiraceae bacterium]|nr:hypothetical protein [Lachnospiraceae bacterium]